MKRSVKFGKGKVHHGGRTIMAKKHKSHHDDDLMVEDDEPESGWTEDTHAEQHEGEPGDLAQPAPAAEPPLPPPNVRLNAVIAELQHSATHNGPVTPSALKELRSIATALGQEGKPAIPVIDSLEPATASEGTLVLVVTGQNFSAGSVICYGDVNQNTQVKTDATQLTATFESGPPGSYVVLVHDPAGDSNEMTFEVT